MIVYDLKCSAGHIFEAWFGSGEDFEDQRSRGLVLCPACGATGIEKAVMAPAVPKKSNRSSGRSVTQTGKPTDEMVQAVMQKLASAQAEVLKDSKWVGRAFAETARAMHYGEQSHTSIHGEVAPQEAAALIDEGVNVAPLPFPVVPPEARN